jgi:hypothetical protein
VNPGRKTVNWFIGIAWLFSALMVAYHVRTILLHASRPIPVWFEAALWMCLLSGAVFGVAQWSVLKERPPVRTWGLLWASVFLLFTISTAIIYWRIGLFDCLAFAFALEQIVFYVRLNPESPVDHEVTGDPEESQNTRS